ncbi:MAG: GNAT family N-acetyltransferase [Pseudomonadota bacterium]
MALIRDIVSSDFDVIVELNAAEVAQTSPMDRERLAFLVQESSYSKVAVVGEEVAAFLLCLDSRAKYPNDNFAWFKDRFSNFLYVDRIVVKATFAGQRIGSELYTDMFAFARQLGLKLVTCEYNINPPNLASDVFHRQFGFKEVGTHWVTAGTKQVSLQTAEL